MTEQEKLLDNHVEEICKLCEDEIIEGPSRSSTFLCEGRFCKEAQEKWLEERELSQRGDKEV